MKPWWKRCSGLLSKPSATVLILRDDQPLTVFDPIRHQSWNLVDLQKRPTEEWPLAPWDIRIGLAFHQILCVPPLAGLHEEEYPAYWNSAIQKAFPDQRWAIAHPEVVVDSPTLLTALPYSLTEALKPFDASIQWCRPAWSSAFAQAKRQLSAAQQTNVNVWIWEEGSRLLWLQRHNHARLGWKKAVIRHVPENQKERHTWLLELLERELSDYSGEKIPAIVHVHADEQSLTHKTVLHTHTIRHWHLHTSNPVQWLQESGL